MEGSFALFALFLTLWSLAGRAGGRVDSRRFFCGHGDGHRDVWSVVDGGGEKLVEFGVSL